MALSNIFKEPRREITETVVGLGAVVAIIAGAIGLGYGNAYLIGSTKHFYFIWFMSSLLLPLLLIMLTAIAHEIGDGICDTLEARGIQMRPKQRHR